MAAQHPNHALLQRVIILEKEVNSIKRQLSDESQLRNRLEEIIMKEIESLKTGREDKNAHPIVRDLEEELKKERDLRIKVEEKLQKETELRLKAEKAESEWKRETEAWKRAYYMSTMQKCDKIEALADAAYMGNLTEVQFLLDQSVSPTSILQNSRDGSLSTTPLHEAVRGGHVDVCRLMSEHSKEYLKCSNILCYAADKCTADVCQVLISCGANINAKDSDGYTALHCAARYNNTHLCELLISSGADVNVKDSRGNRALHYATAMKNTHVCQLLISSGADVNAKDGGGDTALLCAAHMNYLHMCELLISTGADVNSKDRNGTALHWAVCNNTTHLCELLISSGADVNAKLDNGDTALHWAVGKNNTQVCELLINSGADVNVKGSHGNTALHKAAGVGNLQTVQLLTDSKAGLFIGNDCGKTALQLAQEFCYDSVVQYLKHRMESR